MSNIRGTETEKNLLKAFAGESQARNRYTFFAQKAKEEGFIQVERIFLETAGHEKEHAERFFSFLPGEPLEITATYPAGKVGTTIENLTASANGEKEEWHDIYPKFADIAEKEGFKDVAVAFRNIAKAEANHEERYRKLLAKVQNGAFAKDTEATWECINCGFIFVGKQAPNKCPACLHDQSFFAVNREKWLD